MKNWTTRLAEALTIVTQHKPGGRGSRMESHRMNRIFQAAGLVSAACAATLLVSCGPPAGSGATAKPDRPAVPVLVARAETRPMERTVTIAGSLAAQESSVLSTKVPGRLRRVTVDVGSRVAEGDVVAEIEPRDYELRLQMAAAALAEARVSLGLDLDGKEDAVNVEYATLVRQARAVLEESAKHVERVRRLSASDIASRSELDTAEATHAVAQARHETAMEEARSRVAVLAQRRAEYEIAQKQLEDTRVRAPFAGAIQTRTASPGEYVATGAPIVTLVQIDPLRLRLEVPERDAFLVATGQSVRLVAEGLARTHHGRVVRMSPALDARSRALRVEAQVPNDGTLRPGLFVRADIVVTPDEPGLAVPRRALVTFAGIKKIFIIQDGAALEHNVSTGREGGDWIEIRSGLDPGATVILDADSLHSGQPVQVIAPGSTPARPDRSVSQASGGP
jgi:RND family efflux transporter MFP subunit